MDSQSTSAAAPDALAAMLQNSTIDKVERSEFSNTARDMFKFVLNYNPNIHSAAPPVAENTAPEFHDAINYFLNAVPLFLDEVRKNDQSRSAVSEPTSTDTSDPIQQTPTPDQTMNSFTLENPVDVVDIVPPEPFLLPIANVADRYTRSMLKCLLGYPLYNPKPFSEHSKDYPRNGVNVGDVGFVRGNGTFDFLFNVCPPQSRSVNPPNLPEDFSFETSNYSGTTDLEPLPKKTCLFQSPVIKTASGEYICEGSEGAILELPEGAIQHEATNIRPFEKLAARNGVQWYEYTMNRGRKISNGSLYLITSFTKCTQWGTAVFDRPCISGQGLRFERKRSLPFGKSASKHHWKGSRTFHTKVADPDQADDLNQCVFVRGYKIMIRQDIFDNICNDQPHISGSAIVSSSSQTVGIHATRQPATRIRGGAGPDPLSRMTSASLFSRTSMTTSDEEATLHPNFNSSLVHPSDLINVALLSQHPGAKVAITHDNAWCDLLQNNFLKLDYAKLINIAQAYKVTIDEHRCIWLEEISESSSLLDGSGHTSTIQGPLAMTNNDFIPDTPSTATVAVTLPSELVERILLLLDPESILTCRLADRAFNDIIQSSMMLQYFLACKAAGVTDNSRSPLTFAERLEALKRWEEAWKSLKPVFERTIKVTDQLGQTSSSYELAAGMYFLSDKDRKDLYYCHLPSSPQDDPQWMRIPGDGPQQSWTGIVDHIIAAIYEHDLIVPVILSEEGAQRYSLDLVFLKFSTGEYHPDAHYPRLHIQSSDSALPFVNTRIIGDNIALIVGSHSGSFREKLLIYDWKTGYKRLEHETIEDAYAGFVFISPELLLVPNYACSYFEVWYLPCSQSDRNPPTQILSLQIPEISASYSVNGIWCRGELSPFLLSMPHFPPRPFFPTPEDSIIIATFRFQSFLEPTDQNTYTLIVDRRKLLDTIQRWISPSFLEQQNDPQTWSTNEVIVQQVTDPDDGSIIFSAYSNLVSTHNAGTYPVSQNSPTIPTPHISSEPGSISSVASPATRYDILKIKWADWGPPVSRWFRQNGNQAWRVNRSIGQRYAFIAPNSRDGRISVADFNPYKVRRNAGTMDEEEEFELLGPDDVFSEEVYMGLKCVVSEVPGEYDFDAVLMDEERLLGLKVDDDNKVESIKVLYIG